LSRQNKKSNNICTLFKFIFIQILLKNIGATINMIKKNFKIFHLKIPLYEKKFFLAKGPQKGQ